MGVAHYHKAQVRWRAPLQTPTNKFLICCPDYSPLSPFRAKTSQPTTSSRAQQNWPRAKSCWLGLASVGRHVPGAQRQHSPRQWAVTAERGWASVAGGGGRSGADLRPRAPSSSQGVTETAPDLAATTSASHAPPRHWSPGSPERCPRRHTGMPASISTQGTQIINRSLQNESLGKGTHSGTEKPEGWTSADKSRASEHHCLHRARPPLPILPDTVMDNCHQLSSGIVSDCPS